MTSDIPDKKEPTIQTPVNKRQISPENFDSFKSPSVVRSLFTSSKVSLGPTPQKDGRVLGLFDLLDDEHSDTPTNIQDLKSSGDQTHPPDYTTPHKSQTKKDYDGLVASTMSTSPGKRRKLNSVSTPSKNLSSRKNEAMTPLSESKFNLTTPSFLRRDNGIHHQSCNMEAGQELLLSPQTIRVVKKPRMKTLSSILASLRETQDEDLDNELEVLREIEAEELGLNKPTIGAIHEKDNLKFTDNQVSLHGPANWLLDEPSSDHAPELSDQQTKTYVKKGQKRTTRRIKMKPTPSIKPVHGGHQKLKEKISDSDDKVTLIGNDANTSDSKKSPSSTERAGNFNSDDSQSEYTASEGETRYRRPNQNKQKNEGKVKKSSAHQNYKRLKMRNSGAKGNTGRHGGRFRKSRNKM